MKTVSLALKQKLLSISLKWSAAVCLLSHTQTNTHTHTHTILTLQTDDPLQ